MNQENTLSPFRKVSILLTIALLINATASIGQQNKGSFKWPDGKKVAISLSFDDARTSQVDAGTALLNQYGVKATFYVVPSGVRQRLEGWKKAVASGHEIGNHSMLHPCTGNFDWSRQKALEDYSLDKMQKELTATNDSIQSLLGVKAVNFAYPCGQKFVGRGVDTKSYVPVVAKLFLTGRGWMDEATNDPTFCDFAQLTGIESDGKDFSQILSLINEAEQTGKWIVLGGHEMGESGPQTTRLTMLKELIEYAQNPANGIWLAPVKTVATYIKAQRK